MTDIVNTDKRSQMMAGIKGKNTKPEVTVRKILHRLGYRFRLHRKDLPGKPDIILPRYNLVIFVHGCFWHGHENCNLFRLPKTRTEFWEKKITGNKRRDAVHIRSLISEGYRVLVVWECVLKGKTSMSGLQIGSEIDSFISENRCMKRSYFSEQVYG